MKRVALIGEYDPGFRPHAATDAAILHSQAELGVEVSASWLSTEDIDAGTIEMFSGIWVAPGSPYRDMSKTIWAIRHARENGVPRLGTCGGTEPTPRA
jgi:CTP synthase (UTP-ammonia lyase)